MTTVNKLNLTVTLKRFDPSEEGPAEMKGAELKQKKEGFSQRETSVVFGAQTHRPTAIHYREGGWGERGGEKDNR